MMNVRTLGEDAAVLDELGMSYLKPVAVAGHRVSHLTVFRVDQDVLFVTQRRRRSSA